MNLKEVDKPEVKKTVVVYSGRFQPFHSGHYITYLKLAKKFGKDNVYIGTSNDTSGPKSPFNFNEKVKIMTTMFGVPSDKIEQVRNPYAPKEILSQFDGKTTQYIAAVGEKDANRLSGKYFKPYNGKAGYGYDEIGYVYPVPAEKNPISGTDVRNWLSSGDDEEKKKGFLKAYPKFDKEIFKMITGKLNESVNTEPSSALRPEPHPIRHDVEHPEDEKKAFDGNKAPYDPIGEIIQEFITNEMFEDFLKGYLGEAPNANLDQDISYKDTKGRPKKIKARSALRLPKDHPAHIQAAKLVSNDKGGDSKTTNQGPPKPPPPPPPALPGTAKKQAEKPSIPGQPAKQGQTPQGKVDKAKEKGAAANAGGEAPQQTNPQQLKGAELKSDAEKSPKDKAKELAKQVAKKNLDTLKSILKDDFTKEEAHDAHEVSNPNSETRKGWGERIGNFLKSAPANIIKGAYQVAKAKYHQLKNTGRGIQSLVVSASQGKMPRFGMFKDRDGKWKHSEEESKRQRKACWNTVKDVAVIAGSVMAGGAITGAISHITAGGSLGGVGQAAVHGFQHIFTGGATNVGAGEMVHHFAHHCAVDFAKHCGWESLFLGAGAGHGEAYIKAAGAGLAQAGAGASNIMQNIGNVASKFMSEGEEDETKQHADMMSKMVMDVLEKMKDWTPSTEQMLDSAQSYLKSKQLSSLQNLTQPINENLSDSKKANIQNFIEYGTKRLKLKEQPRISFIEGEEYAHAQSSLGGYNPQTKEIYVAVEGRLTADILRTLAHEMVHRKQDELGLVGDPIKAGADGSPVENQAHAVAGILMREYGRLNKQIYTEVSNVGTANTADVPDGAFIKKGKKRTLDKEKAESWYTNGGYTQTEFPKADAIFGDEDAEERTIKYTIKNLPDVEYVETDFFKEDINVDVDKGDEVLMGKFKNKKVTVKDIGTDDHGMPTINGKKAVTFRIPRGNGQDVFDEVTTNDWHFKAIMKLYDKASSFGKKKIGAVVCADPNASRRDIVVQLRDSDYDEVTTMTDKLGLNEYIEKKKLNESINSKNHKPHGSFDRKFNLHHKSSSYTPDMGYGAELDTIDFDDLRDKKPGHQTDTKDTEDRGYEPVKNEKLNQSNLDSVERYADRELDPADIEFSNHFFDRVNDTRNGKEISEPELTGFFKRLSRHKKQFLDFLDKYNQIVVKDDRSNINIPFVKMANKVIAKTVMRKGDFQTSSPTIVNEITQGLYAGTLKIGGKPVEIEVELLGADNKTKEFLTKIIHIDKQYQSKLPIGSTFRIPARIFRLPGGGWHKIKSSAFKEALNEVKWEDGTYEHCMRGKLPLSLNIVQKLVEPIRTTSLHATDIDNLPTVASLQGTKKAISTFTKTTKWGKLVQGKGMHTKGGIIVALSGTVLAQSIMDLWTAPDRQGRRWVNPGTVIADLGREQDVVFNFAPELKKYKEEWMKNMFDKPATNQEKAEFIKKYYDAAERYMLSKKKEFQDKYLNSNALYYDSDWNEVVLSQIKIESILVVPELLKIKTQVGSWTFDREDKNETDKIIKQLKQKYKNVVVAKDESDIANFITTNGGSIINESTDPSDIIKDLDKVRTDLIKKVEVLIAKKKKLYSNVDIESPMSADEKQLDKDIQSIFSQIQDLIQQKRKIKKPLNEGGAYGHMSHPFDDMNLTFGDLKKIITGALVGELELTREKTDGQALAISWKNGRLIAARNKGHLADAGANAMGIEDVASKFAGRGGLTDAYNFAMNDLSAAISSLSDAQRTKIFNEGKCFMNLEVIWPTSVNVIPYGQALLVFHNTTCYDEKGVAVGADQSAATKLAGMIKQVNADVQSKYTIQGPPVTKLPKNEELSSKQNKYITQLQRLQHQFQLSDRATVAEYHQAWWENFIDKDKPKLQKLEREALVRRWAFGDKSFRLNTIADKDAQMWAIEHDKVNVEKQQKENIRPFEELFLSIGADVLSFMSSVLTVNPDVAIRNMADRMEATAEKVRGSGDISKLQKLEKELQRLQNIGGKDKIVPNEGIVFVYKGNTYKLTGTFAPLNQILGIFYE